MSDREKLTRLLERLNELRDTKVADWERPIREAACTALENEITDIGQRLVRRLRAAG